MNELTFPVNFVDTSSGFPTFEPYEYTGQWLPDVGDVITITRASTDDTGQPQQRLAYVTSVNRGGGGTPIRATAPAGITHSPADDYIVSP